MAWRWITVSASIKNKEEICKRIFIGHCPIYNCEVTSDRGQLNKAELLLTHMIERCLKRCEADDLSGYSAYAFIDVFGLDKLDRTWCIQCCYQEETTCCIQETNPVQFLAQYVYFNALRILFQNKCSVLKDTGSFWSSRNNCEKPNFSEIGLYTQLPQRIISFTWIYVLLKKWNQ